MATNRATGRQKGKSEIVSAAMEIAERRALGQSLRQVHDALTEEKAISLPYTTFVRWVNRLEAERLDMPTTPTGLPGSAHRAGKHGRNGASGTMRPDPRPADMRRETPSNVEVRNGVVFASIGDKPFPRKPPGHQPDMKKLIGEDYEG